jgi:cytochrome c-type biogenesis protein CcmF
VSWVWIGYWVVLFGTIICLIPSKTKLVFPRTEVVGMTSKQAGKPAQVGSNENES